ncbi:MAG: hypothetical protein ACHQEB_04645 [Chitinophagales bacterium]
MSVNSNIIIRTVKLTVLFSFFPLIFFGQKLTGLWTGSLSNDSSTIRRDQLFEIALTEYRGKVYGYSRSEFIINDTLYYILKRVKGTIDGDVCEVKDDEILSYNFRGKLDKGVKVISTFRMNKEDSTWYLDGNWKTNKTKNYYSLTGKIDLQEEKDLSQSKLFPHLEELNLANEVAFYKEQKKVTEPVIKNQPEVTKEPVLATSKKKKEEKRPDLAKKTEPQTDNKESTITSTEPENKKSEAVVASVTTQPQKDEQAIEKTGTTTEPVKTAPRKKEQPVTAITQDTKKVTLSETAVNSEIKKSDLKIIGPAAFAAERKSVFLPAVSFKSDSLELSLYDNGEIDGDTVSVLLNGKIIIANQCLKASAIKKTIYITPETGDSLVLVLYAENLGKYPPNTGLLVIHDGDDVYHVNFSADLQTNAAITLRRKQLK